MTSPTEYLVEIRAALIASPVVRSFKIVEEWSLPDRGYIRVRMNLANGDFAEAVEYFVATEGDCVPARYRHQWMDGSQQCLRRRWDNVEHYPDLPSFPHHVHLADGRIEPGACPGILGLLKALSAEIATSE
jgi:hypothetical protein